ncbi:hypothetical protein PQE75_gp059 [Bacillus phage vB_BcoS-136]|uniref:Peptidase C39 domain-containing protein n=1 Tax=Bacillus phage vB_BcoS-136 TaxID=2419619 RepID=A0A3G3BVL7_9CAUD|nr:hypothetical protein PQE75_gp059 [Bacillus phage vB_BcoS-136]AYP68191.1 hypothetical protein vBBcoS136_00059 [Bacillus phage vB_BcoS-136]
MRKLKYFKQPTKNTCGQTTIAMLCGITPQESIEVFGHNRSSRYKDYVRVLNQLGVSHGEIKKVDNRKKYDLPRKAIVRMNKTGNKNGHLIAYCDGVFYDPWYGIFHSKEELLEYWNVRKRYGGKWRIDWFIEIFEDVEMKKSS